MALPRYDGAVLVGIAEGATMLGQKGSTPLKEEYQTEKEKRNFFKTLGIVPSVIVTGQADDSVTHEMAHQLGPGTIILGVPR
eukprot:gene49384-52949_t